MTNLPPVSEAAIEQIWRDLHKVVYARGEVAVGRNAYDDEAEAKAIIRKAFVTELQHSRAEEAVAWIDRLTLKSMQGRPTVAALSGPVYNTKIDDNSVPLYASQSGVTAAEAPAISEQRFDGKVEVPAYTSNGTAPSGVKAGVGGQVRRRHSWADTASGDCGWARRVILDSRPSLAHRRPWCSR